KAKTNICVGSPALLLAQILEERGHEVFRYDPIVEQREKNLSQMAPHVFLVGTNHPEFSELVVPKGSVVIDPWRFVTVNDGVHLVPLGSKSPTVMRPKHVPARGRYDSYAPAE